MNAIGKFDIAAAAVMVVAVVALVVKPSGGVDEEPTSTAPSRSPIAAVAQSPAPSSAPDITTILQDEPVKVDEGPYVMAWPGTRIGSSFEATSGSGIRLSMPAGWWSADGGSAVVGGGEQPGLNSPTLAGHDVRRVVTDTCPGDAPFEDAGRTAADLTTALGSVVGLEVSGPTDVILGGHPARKLGLTFSPEFAASCGGPEGRLLWENANGSHFLLLKDGTATVYVVAVAGERLVLTTRQRGASAKELAELDAIVASIHIAKGVSFSFGAPAGGWERVGDISLNRSIQGPQGAEAIVYWTSFVDGLYADPCGALAGLSADASIADVASAVATTPGIEVLSGPSDVTIDGRRAKQVVVVVREDVGCDPGYFYTWAPFQFGNVWVDTMAGDTIRVWIVDVDGTILFIAGATHKETLPGVDLTQAQRNLLDLRIKQTVDSIRFE